MRCRLMLSCGVFSAVLCAVRLPADSLREPATSIPLIRDVDVVVVGGTCAAVSAAAEAARKGARVFLVTRYGCLGEDVAGTLRVWAPREEVLSSDLMRRMFASADEAPPADLDTVHTTPLRVKKALDRELLDAGVGFLTGCYATDVLTDASGSVAGVAVVDRSGRQAIRAKVVIDATARGHLARRAGAEATPFPEGPITVSRVVITHDLPSGDAGTIVRHEGWHPDPDLIRLSKTSELVPRMVECTMTLPVADGSDRSLQQLEQAARDRTFTPTQFDAADMLSYTPPDHIRCIRSVTASDAGLPDMDLDALRPAGVPHLYVLSGLADVPRTVAAAFSRPGPAVLLGTRVGRAAAEEAAARPAMRDVQHRGVAGDARPADIRAVQGMLTRPFVSDAGTVTCGADELPVLADTDLLVVGGGTTGAPAAVGAGRNGVRTLVVEWLHELGGVQTAGMITGYYYGNRCGFTDEIDDGVKATGRVRSQAKGEWYRRAIRQSGGEIWFGTMAVGAWMEGTKLRGVVVVTPDGRRGVVRAAAVIDATGNADVAAAAGEPTEFYSTEELIGQGVGMAVIRLGAGGHNNDFAMVNDSDASDLCFFGLRTRLMTEGGWDVSQLVNSRERRRLVGAYQISVLDYLTARTFPDTINRHRSRFDLHGQASHDFFMTRAIRVSNHVTLDANAPYRALLPSTTDGLLVVGLGMSATRDAMAILRMQADLQNQGYAAAYAAYLALTQGCELRDIDVRALQEHLVAKGNIPASVLDEKDSYPIPEMMLKLATHDLMMGYGNVAFLFADPERAKPLLRERHRELSTHSSGVDKEVSLVYAHLLAVLGDRTGEDELIEWAETHSWGDDWAPGHDAGGNRLGAYILALARAGSAKAVPIIARRGLEKCGGGKLTPSTYVSRVIALASQALRDPAMAEVLARMLECPGVAGHAIAMSADIPPVPGYDSRSNYSQKEKDDTVRELNLAAALYRIGDKDGKGEAILEAYAADPRGFYAHYASLVLGERRP